MIGGHHPLCPALSIAQANAAQPTGFDDPYFRFVTFPEIELSLAYPGPEKRGVRRATGVVGTEITGTAGTAQAALEVDRERESKRLKSDRLPGARKSLIEWIEGWARRGVGSAADLEMGRSRASVAAHAKEIFRERVVGLEVFVLEGPFPDRARAAAVQLRSARSHLRARRRSAAARAGRRSRSRGRRRRSARSTSSARPGPRASSRGGARVRRRGFTDLRPRAPPRRCRRRSRTR